MKQGYLTVEETVIAEVTEKKSRFIGALTHIESESEAQEFIAGRKKEHYNARHNCFAYVFGDAQENLRSGDDGEPQGTAGKPMLDILLNKELTYCAVVVTRYFGGTLLGTGGLVRAYSAALEAAIAQAKLVRKCPAVIYEFVVDYGCIGKILHLLENENVKLLSSEYGQEVQLTVLIPQELEEHILKGVNNITMAKAVVAEKERGCFAI